jgi:hypothetical protein
VISSSLTKGGISDQPQVAVLSIVSRLLTIVNIGPSLRSREKSVIMNARYQNTVISFLKVAEFL